MNDDLVAAICRELVRRRRPLSADRVREVLDVAGLLDPEPPAASALSNSRALRIALTDLAAREA